MAYDPLNLGTTPGDGTGEALRSGGEKLNAMLLEVYTHLSTIDTSLSAIATALAGLTIGEEVQAFSANLNTFSGIAPSANVQSLLGAANFAAINALLGLVVGTNVEAYNAALSPVIPSGRYTSGEGIAGTTGTGGVAPGADSIRLYPVRIRKAITISELKTRIVTLAASGKCQIAIYAADAATLMPTGAPIYHTADLSTASAVTVGETGLSVSIASPGIYWLATMCDTNAATAIFVTRNGAFGSAGELVGAAASNGILALASQNILGLAKSNSYAGGWPTLTGSYSGDGYTEVTSLSMPAVAFKI